ncbi:Z1 domain-containing protein [Nocardioides deserti]|uniref:Putative endonuclease Z1 domain-containing protein n=1 Tax=Nocardioides deserti TaxID=1588644 RepID=A0ABR6U9X7_9ACTN|nr:Z1 domain-containing protein [Nocardioides deserti]MBC2961244.1 hypothetical protein [Nocardioides deserti]
MQSGKTASMMAVIAKALDAGANAVVVLAGTRTALWLQTLERIDEQLDRLANPTSVRIRLPPPGQGELVGGELGALYSLTEQQARRALDRGRPLLAVVMKNVAHLERLSRTLHETVYPEVERRGEPFHLVVLDDEADDSSIDDPGAGPAELRQVPRRILDLWESRRTAGVTAVEGLYATYVAYTATPQANFLQDPANPLAPTDFVVALRTPGPEGDVDVRTPSFRTARGYRSWYTGGEVFYHRFRDAPLCVEPRVDPSEALVDGVRAFLLASAVRLMRGGAQVTPADARGRVFASQDEAKALLPDVASMLVHPSSALDAHFAVADDLVAWSGGTAAAGGHERRLGVPGVRKDLEEQPDRWLRWLQGYRASAALCASELGGEVPWVPPDDRWAQVKKVVLEDVVPGTSVAVINSDERADDRPEFSVQRSGKGWRAPRNLSTIFVSGNVMARGITLEGLSTTVFTREAHDPLADTQMQMQRWFGYRGSYIELCRVIASSSQLGLFARYHDNDEALRRQVIAAMEEPAGAAPRLSVLQGLDHRATGKVADLRGKRLWPGARPFVQHMNAPGADDHNQQVLARLFAQGLQGVPDPDARQGVLADRLLDLDQAADLLDELHYVGLQPGAVERWALVEAQLDLPPADARHPLYRGPQHLARPWHGVSTYDLAAYLRTWAALLEQRTPGFFTTDEPSLQWSLLDLAQRRKNAPVFRVGMRFGSGPEVADGPLAVLPAAARPMKRQVRPGTDVLDSTWGSRGESDAGIMGDEFFDFYGREEGPRLTRNGARHASEPGLLLFHLVAREGGPPTIALGVSLPAGGPDQVMALRRSGG